MNDSKKLKILTVILCIMLAALAMAAQPRLERDTAGNPIQGALSPIVAQTVSTGAVTARNATSFTHPIIRVTATTDCFIKLGDTSVEAANTDHFLPAGVVEYFATRGNVRIAAIRSAVNGTLYISEMY